MTSVHQLYARDVYENLKYRPTWLPGTPMYLGTVGVIEDGQFRAVTDLNRLGIPFEEIIDSDHDTIDFTSKGGVSIAFKAAGEVNPRFQAVVEANAGILVEFSRVGAVLLQMRDVSLNRIADQSQLRRDMLRAVAVGDESKQWRKEWVVITEVARADIATIVISNSGRSRLELNASGSAASTSLADVSANLSVATESDLSFRVIAKEGLTPLYRGLRVKRPFFWLYNEVLPASSEAPPPDKVFGEADPSEDDWVDSPDREMEDAGE